MGVIGAQLLIWSYLLIARISRTISLFTVTTPQYTKDNAQRCLCICGCAVTTCSGWMNRMAPSIGLLIIVVRGCPAILRQIKASHLQNVVHNTPLTPDLIIILKGVRCGWWAEGRSKVYFWRYGEWRTNEAMVLT